MSLFGPVRTVRRALARAGSDAPVVRLPAAAGPQEAARALGAPPGALVQSLVYVVGEQPALVLLAGDKACDAASLPRTLNRQGEARPATEAETRRATGFAPGGVAPVGLARALPVVIDVSLKRFATVYVPAGKPGHVFATSADELKRLTGGLVSYAVTDGGRYHPGHGADAKAV